MATKVGRVGPATYHHISSESQGAKANHIAWNGRKQKMLKKIRKGQSMSKRSTLAAALCAAALTFASATKAEALIITGSVDQHEDKHLLSGSPVHVTTNTVLKISF